MGEQLLRDARRGTGHALGLPVRVKEACKDNVGDMLKDCLGDMDIAFNLFNNSSDMLSSRLSLVLSLLLGTNNFDCLHENRS